MTLTYIHAAYLNVRPEQHTYPLLAGYMFINLMCTTILWHTSLSFTVCVYIVVSEPNRATGTVGSGPRPPPNTSRTLRPIPKFQNHPGKIYHHPHRTPLWAPQTTSYRKAKQHLMHGTSRPVRQNVVRESPGTVAMKETIYRHRMHGVAK